MICGFRMFLRTFVEGKILESKIEDKLAHLVAELGRRSRWNLRAYTTWYVRHEFTFYDEFEKYFRQPF